MNTPPEDFPPRYEAIRSGLAFIAQHYNRMTVEGLEHVPPPGQGALLCSSHENYADPFYLASAVQSRFLRFLAEPQAFDMPFVGQLAADMGMVRVNVAQGRSRDPEQARQALQTVADHVRQGDLCVVFPEGMVKHWVEGDHLRRFKTGAVRIAALSGRPIVPCALYGTRWTTPNLIALDLPRGQTRVWGPLVLPAKVTVKIGQPMDIDPRADGDKDVAQRETKRLRGAIAALRFDLKRRYNALGR